MAQLTGTLGISDLLAVENQSVLEFGPDEIAQAIATELQAHNAKMEDMISSLARLTTERVANYGADTGGDMQEVDEHGRAPTQKVKGRAPVAYPLRKYQFNIGWTDDFQRRMTPADMARQTLNAQARHRVRVVQEIQRALYVATNYTFADHLTDNLELAVKRLVNADGAAIPAGPGGETFDGSTHTHYSAIDWGSANEAQRTAAVAALVTTVIEHGHGAAPILVIARGDEAKMAQVTDFEPYKPVQIAPGISNDNARGTLVTGNLYNRAIGVLSTSGTEVWVKPWGLVGYMLLVDIGTGPEGKPLAFRQHEMAPSRGLQVRAIIEAHPLTAQYMEAYFGFGVQQRTNGAILHLGDGSYVNPTF